MTVIRKTKSRNSFTMTKLMVNIKLMLFLGGGSKYFGKENGNLTDKFQKDGYDYVTNKDELANSQSDQVLGLFSEKICLYKSMHHKVIHY